MYVFLNRRDFKPLQRCLSGNLSGHHAKWHVAISLVQKEFQMWAQNGHRHVMFCQI